MHKIKNLSDIKWEIKKIIDLFICIFLSNYLFVLCSKNIPQIGYQKGQVMGQIQL